MFWVGYFATDKHPSRDRWEAREADLAEALRPSGAFLRFRSHRKRLDLDACSRLCHAVQPPLPVLPSEAHRSGAQKGLHYCYADYSAAVAVTQAV